MSFLGLGLKVILSQVWRMDGGHLPRAATTVSLVLTTFSLVISWLVKASKQKYRLNLVVSLPLKAPLFFLSTGGPDRLGNRFYLLSIMF